MRITWRDPNERRQSTAQLIQAQLAEAGSRSSSPRSPTSCSSMTGNFDLALFGWTASATLSGSDSIYRSDGGQNHSHERQPGGRLALRPGQRRARPGCPCRSDEPDRRAVVAGPAQHSAVPGAGTAGQRAGRSATSSTTATSTSSPGTRTSGEPSRTDISPGNRRVAGRAVLLGSLSGSRRHPRYGRDRSYCDSVKDRACRSSPVATRDEDRYGPARLDGHPCTLSDGQPGALGERRRSPVVDPAEWGGRSDQTDERPHNRQAHQPES